METMSVTPIFDELVERLGMTWHHDTEPTSAETDSTETVGAEAFGTEPGDVEALDAEPDTEPTALAS